MSEQKSNISNLATPVMVLLLIVGSFFIGRLSLEVSNLKKDKVVAPVAAANDKQAAPERKLDVPSLKEKAKSLGMNGDFDTCLDSGKYAERVASETKEGQNLGVSGTPSFLINGLLVVGAQPQASFEKVIDAELKNGGGAVVAKELGENGKRNKMNYGSGPVFGPKEARVKIVEFTDFECPYCERAFPILQSLMKKYEGKISLEYKSFPLSFHPSAQKAAEAALCAGEQGKFWEMHDNIFTPPAQ